MEAARTADQKIIETALQFDILDALEELIDLQQSTLPEGILDQQGPIVVTSAVTTLDSGTVQTMPWKGFTLFNDGPGPALFVTVNKNYFDAEVPLRIGQPLNFDAGRRHHIRRMMLTTKGPITGMINGNTNVRIFALK